MKREVNDLNFDVSLHLVFASKAAHDKYQDHPRHLKFVEENKENWEKVRVFDSYLSPVPAPPRARTVSSGCDARRPRGHDPSRRDTQTHAAATPASAWACPPALSWRISPCPRGRGHGLGTRTVHSPRRGRRAGRPARTGNGGIAGGFGGGFSASSLSTTSIARSSCGSLPAATAAGSCSTSMSGGTPTFSTTQPSSVKIARFGAVTVPPSISVREAQDAHQPAPGPLAHQLAQAELAEHPRQQVAARARPSRR